jgi:hypothetical protein
MTITYVSKGITRLDLEDTHNHGYMVRITRDGQRFSAYFSDKKCGGKRKAKKLAQESYEQMVKEHGPANHQSCLNRLTKRNNSGHVGVHIAKSTDTRWSGSEYKAYCASWVVEDGRRQKIAFSWNRYGKAKALECAIYARKHLSTDRSAVVKAVEAKLKRKQATKKTAKRG